MSTLHLKATLKNGHLVCPLPPELADTAAEGTTFEVHVELPGADAEDAPLPKPGDGPEAYLRYLETLRPLGNIVLPPQDVHGDLPRAAYGDTA